MTKLSLRLKHLSQEHRAAMLLAYAARDTMPQSEADLPAFIRKICGIFETEMEPHFREEERFAVPQLRVLQRNDLADRTLTEHAAIRAMLVELEREPTPAKVRELSAALEAHVVFEEETVWEVLETAMREGGADQPAAAA